MESIIVAGNISIVFLAGYATAVIVILFIENFIYASQISKYKKFLEEHKLVQKFADWKNQRKTLLNKLR